MENTVLYLTNCYALPEQISVGAATRHYYHVQALAENGVLVNVVTSSVSTISGEQLHFEQRHPKIRVRDVLIESIGRDSLWSRMSYHLKYFFKSIRAGFQADKPKVVVASVPTLLIGWIGWCIATFRRAVFVLDVRDLWTDSLSTTGLARIPFFLTINDWLERFLYARADSIYCTSQSQVEAVQAKTKGRRPVFWVPNGIDPVVSDEVDIHPFVRDIQSDFQWIGLFAGKHSKYTDLDCLISAAKELEGEGFALILLGGGYTKPQLKTRVASENISNVFFHDPVPKSQVGQFEAGADIFFVNYSPEQVWSRVLPNKLFDYLYWNKPVIASVSRGEITRIIEESGSGISVEPGDPQAIAAAVKQCLLQGHPAGNYSREYLFSHFKRSQTVDRFLAVFDGVL